MQRCPDPDSTDNLIAYVLDELDEVQAARTLAHVDNCRVCQARLQRLRWLRQVLAVRPAEVPSAAIVNRAKAIFRQPAPPKLTWQQRLAAIWPLSPRPARLAVISTLLALAMTVSAAPTLALASQSALPGDPLFVVKRMVEQIQLATTLDADDRAVLQLDFVQNRVDEIVALASTERFEDIPPSVDGFRAEIDQTAVAFRAVAERDAKRGQWLVEQVENCLKNGAEALGRLRDSSLPAAQPIIQEAVEVSEVGAQVVQAQLTVGTPVAYEPTPISAPPPTNTPQVIASRAPLNTATAPPAPPTATVLATALPSTAPRGTVAAAPTRTPTFTPTDEATATLAPTLPPTPTPSATEAPSPTPEPTATPEPTSTATDIPIPTETSTEPPASTPVPTQTPVPTDTATPKPSPTDTASPTPSLTPTETPTPTPTGTVTATDTATPTSSPTGTPPTATPAATSTVTPTDGPTPTSRTPTEVAATAPPGGAAGR